MNQTPAGDDVRQFDRVAQSGPTPASPTVNGHVPRRKAPSATDDVGSDRERPTKTPPRRPVRTDRVPAIREWTMLLPVLALGLVFRLRDLTQPFIGDASWNEVFYASIARNFRIYGPLTQYSLGAAESGRTPLVPDFGPSPLVPWLVYLSGRALGPSEWAARFPILILGMLSLVILYYVARVLYDWQIALAATFIAAVMPGIVFYSHLVQLDGPMVTFGLAAVLTLLLFERRRFFWLVAASCAFLGLAILSKYSGVLFIPCLAWVWSRMMRRAVPPGNGPQWPWPAVYFFVAALPAASWFAYGLKASPAFGARGPISGYLNRLGVAYLGDWSAAIQGTWPMLANQVGHIFWYPLIVIVVLSVSTGRFIPFARRHPEVILLIVPWFAQMIYPKSWLASPHYLYPALFGLALLLALLVREIARPASLLLAWPDRNLKIGFVLLGLVACLACASDYREFFHAEYYPFYLVTPRDPFYSARFVRSRNTADRPVLADLPQTLYYAGDNYVVGRQTWRWWGAAHDDRDMIAAIDSRAFSYVVFTYLPTVEVVDALQQDSYRQIAPSAWEKTEAP